MNGFQVTYLTVLVVLTCAAYRGGFWFALGCLWANAVATLAVAGAMDMGWFERTDATLSYMVIDTVTGGILVSRAGLPRVLALLYVITVPTYAANLIFGLPLDGMFLLIYAAAMAQLGVVASALGTGGSGGGGRSRRLGRMASLAPSAGNYRLSDSHMARNSRED